MVFAGPLEEGELTNLTVLLADYGVETAEGVVVEADRSYYAFSTPLIMLPDIQNHNITDSLIESNYYVIMPAAQGLTVGNSSKGTVTELLTTSGSAFSKAAGLSLTSYEKEENDIEGPFALAVAVEDNSGGEMIWIASSYLMDEMYNAYSSGANLNLGMNAISSLIGEREAVAIRSKSLSYNYLTIDAETASTLKTVMIGVLPAGFALLGIGVLVVRRKRRNV